MDAKRLRELLGEQYPVIVTESPELEEKLSKKLGDYRARLDALVNMKVRVDSSYVTDTVYKICILEKLLRKKAADTLMIAEELRAQHSRFDSAVFRNACFVLDDYCRTGGKNVHGGSGLK